MKNTILHVRLGEQYTNLLEEIMRHTGVTKTKLAQIMLDKSAEDLGIKPVGSVPKFFALTE